MKTKTTIPVLILCLVILGLFVWGYAQNGNAPASVQGVTSSTSKIAMVSQETFYDFGTISMKNGNVSKDFVLTNSTNNDVVIRGVETSCMCTTALLVAADGSHKGPFGMAGMGGRTTTNDTVKAGESRTLRVVYDPNAHGPAGVGRINRSILVTDSSGASLRFEIKALVTP